MAASQQQPRSPRSPKKPSAVASTTLHNLNSFVEQQQAPPFSITAPPSPARKDKPSAKKVLSASSGSLTAPPSPSKSQNGRISSSKKTTTNGSSKKSSSSDDKSSSSNLKTNSLKSGKRSKSKDKLDLFLEQQQKKEASEFTTSSIRKAEADERSRGAYSTMSAAVPQTRQHHASASERKHRSSRALHHHPSSKKKNLSAFLNAHATDGGSGETASRGDALEVRSTYTSMTDARKRAFAKEHPPVPQSRDELITLLRRATEQTMANNKKQQQQRQQQQQIQQPDEPRDASNSSLNDSEGSLTASPSGRAKKRLDASSLKKKKKKSGNASVSSISLDNIPEEVEDEDHAKNGEGDGARRRTKTVEQRRPRRRRSKSQDGILDTRSSATQKPRASTGSEATSATESSSVATPQPNTELRRPSGAPMPDADDDDEVLSSPTKSLAIQQRRMSNPTRLEFSARKIAYGGTPMAMTSSSNHGSNMVAPGARHYPHHSEWTTHRPPASSSTSSLSPKPPRDVFALFAWTQSSSSDAETRRTELQRSIRESPLHKALGNR